MKSANFASHCEVSLLKPNFSTPDSAVNSVLTCGNAPSQLFRSEVTKFFWPGAYFGTMCEQGSQSLPYGRLALIILRVLSIILGQIDHGGSDGALLFGGRMTPESRQRLESLMSDS